MFLLSKFSKLVLYKNYLSYLRIIFSIILTYVLLAFTIVYMDNVLILSTEPVYSNLHNIFISIRTIFFMAGITFIIYQYYNIMKSSVREYCILRGLGATKNTIRILILLQMFFLLIISIPIGLSGGYYITGLILRFIEDFTVKYYKIDWIVSSTTFCLTAVAFCCFIISLGIYLERGIRKMPLSCILSDWSITLKEG